MSLGRVVVAVLALLLTSSCAMVGRADTRHAWTRPHVLRIASSEEPDSLNPMVGFSQTEVHLSMFWGGYLFN